MEILLNYTISSRQVVSEGGGHPLDFNSGTPVSGPTKSTLGSFNKALRLGGTASAKTTISDVALNLSKFTVRAVVRAVGIVKSRQNIIESNRYPFALFIDKGKTNTSLNAIGSVNTQAYGWRGVDTRFHTPVIRSGIWFSVDLVYDEDTLALFIKNQLVDIQAFPKGTLKNMRGSEMFVGSWVDGRRNRFSGDIAALQLISGVPEELETKLDEARSMPPWHISRKRIDLESALNLGNETSKVRYDAASTAYVQDFQHGLIMYHDSLGAAFEMHGGIWNFYKRYGRKSAIGYLITDESDATKHRARKSLFSKGGIYWSSSTGALPVLGQIFLDYENLGESAVLGLPSNAESNIPGGKQQIFQSARMYHKNGAARAHEVHGRILTRFLASGGTNKWGFPITDEVDIRKSSSNPSQSRIIGKSSEFENAIFYWSSRTDAYEVHGDIRRKYQASGGPPGQLGFPTSNEQNIPGYSGAGRMNTFEKGSICWYGNYNSIIVARPFKIFVGRVSTRENEGFGMGQNDLYTYIKATDGQQTYDKRHPSSGDWGGRNSKNINLTIPKTFQPNKANYTVNFRFKCVDADPGRDDHLGTFTKSLNAANGWGLRHHNGVYNTSFSKVRSLTWSVKPQVNISQLSETEKWWGKDNDGTNKINYQKYARAFRDVDSDAEWWDLTDWLEKAFYELVVEGLAKGGNCFGMSLEGIYARKNRSVFGLPLDRFKTWSTLESEFNIKHCYQVGAEAIWWFLGQFVTGNTHDPKDVFNRTWSAFNRGEHPVICVSQNYDFSGAPHCILPVGWNKSSSQWTVSILDPNFPGQLRQLTINPSNNTFFYDGSSDYRGGEWSGGRLHYMPYDILDVIPRTPIWDAILLILAGTIVIFGSDTDTVGIKDMNGRDLNAFGHDATARLKRGEPIEDCFFDYKGFAGREALTGGMLFRRTPLRGSADIRTDGTLSAHQPINSLSNARFRTAQPLVTNLRAASPDIRANLAGRTAHAVLADSALRPTLDPDLVNALQDLSHANREGAFDHRLRGRRSGKLEYALCSAMTAARLDTPIRQGEIADLSTRDLASSKQSLAIKTRTSRLVDLIYETRLGASKDRVEVKISHMAAAANKPLKVNLRPGIGGVDLATSNQRVDAQISVKAMISGKTVQRRYTVPIQDGARIHLSKALDEGRLSVSRIDRLFGRPTGNMVLQPR